MSLRNFILDIDGTIWNTTDVVAIAWNKAIADANLPALSDLVVTGEMLKGQFGKPMDVIADNLFGPIDASVKADLLAKCCVYEHEEIAACTMNLTYPGVTETIEDMQGQAKFYIVSNCQDGYIELVIEKNHLQGLICDYESFGKTGLQKDENISLVMERNGLTKENTFYVGDIQGDCDASHKAGIPFIHASYGFGEVPDADYVIHSFEEIKTLKL